MKLTSNKVNKNKGYALYTDSATTGYQITKNDFNGNGNGVKLGSTNGTAGDNQGMTKP